MFPFLPPTLVALVLASLAFAAPKSSNDPFKALAAHVVKRPEPPICCLTPLPTTETPQDDVLLSFEEWKEKRFAMQNIVQAKAKEKETAVGDRAVERSDAATPSAEVPSSPAAPQDAPHFRVPLTDRFNYASLDCSARVHTSHRASKSPASILSSKRDRYMLSPCRPPKGEQQFVVVELCEDIRIDTVQLANFEFFSGVFKDFTVSVSKTYTTDPEGWTFASTHTAKNIRVVQSFHPPTSLRDFYRYIRIDFHSHYSNEYYCPISLLRVYGLTHLEEYKWDIWETESRARAKRDEQLAAAPSAPLDVNEPEPAIAPEPVRIPASYAEYMDAAATEREQKREPTTQSVEANSQSSPDIATAPESSNTRGDPDSEHLATGEPPETGDTTTVSSPSTTTTATPEQAPPQTKSQSLSSSSSFSHDSQASPPSESVLPPNGSEPAPSSDTTTAATSVTSTSTTTTPTTVTGVVSGGSGSIVSTLSTTSLVPAPAGGESIYRTIMNRLTALEANHTLYARYVEEHTGAVREMLRRVGEDLGRAEGVGKAQAQTHARTLLEWERQRKRVDAEYRELMRRVEFLSDEIVLEKRLGIAQLLLLLAVLVFMTLTRGSRGEAVMVPSVSRSALRAWGRRHLSLKSLSGSGDWDWVGRLKSRSRSRSPGPPPPKPKDEPDPPIKLEFPKVDQKPPPSAGGSKPKPPRLNLHGHATRPRSRTRSTGNNTVIFDAGPRARSRTPTLMRTPYRRPATPNGSVNTHATPGSLGPLPMPMQYPISQGTHVPKSARRWARTAHLHELRGGSAQRVGAARDATVPRSAASVLSSDPGLGADLDVFASPSPAPSGAMSADLLDMGLRASGSGGLLFRGIAPSPSMRDRRASADDASEGDMWVDTDEGSDMDGDGDRNIGLESPWMDRVEQVAVGA